MKNRTKVIRRFVLMSALSGAVLLGTPIASITAFADEIGGDDGGELPVGEFPDGTDEPAQDYEIDTAKMLLDAKYQSLIKSYTFSEDNRASLDSILSNSKEYITNNNLTSIQLNSYISSKQTEMEALATAYGTPIITDIPDPIPDAITPATSSERAIAKQIIANYQSAILLDFTFSDDNRALLGNMTGSAVTYIDAHPELSSAEVDAYVASTQVKMDDFAKSFGTMIEKESATGGENASLTPRLIVTGFDTDPKEIMAGDEFTLTLHVKNTSKTTDIYNILFTLQANPETNLDGIITPFLPVSGSSTLYLDSLKADTTTDITMAFSSRADLNQKPYVIAVEMAYENKNAQPFVQTAEVSIPIHQEAKFEVSNIEMYEQDVFVGDDSTIEFAINNIGKTPLYNVKIKFDQTYVTGGDEFIGKITPGVSTYVSTTVTGLAPNDGEPVDCIISYEDENGVSSEMIQPISLYINDTFNSDTEDIMYDEEGNPIYIDDDEYNNELPEKKGISPIVYLVGAVVVIGAIVAVILIVGVVKKKKKAKTFNNIIDQEDLL